MPNARQSWQQISAVLAISLLTSLPAPAGAEATVKNAISPTKAGTFFASICFNIYPDVAEAQKVVQQKGFRYNPETKLFEHPRRDQQMRINANRCGFRFLTKDKPPKLGALFAEASTNKAIDPSDGAHVQIDVFNAENGLVRAAVKLDR